MAAKAIKEFFLGKDKAAKGRRNVDEVVKEAMTGKKAAAPKPAKKPVAKKRPK